jgi:phage tail-like protein
MSPATRTDPYLVENFLVEIQGITAASFTEVSGLEASIEVIDYRNGDSKLDSVQKLPGLSKVSNITLKRGMVQDLSLWNWMQAGLNGAVQRTNVSIILLDRADNPLWRWNLTNAWPVRWSGPVLKAESGDVAIETLEICYESLIASTGS